MSEPFSGVGPDTTIYRPFVRSEAATCALAMYLMTSTAPGGVQPLRPHYPFSGLAGVVPDVTGDGFAMAPMPADVLLTVYGRGTLLWMAELPG